MKNSMRGLNLLVVDDQVDLLETLGSWFEGYGAKIFTASNGIAAFEIINSQRVDIVLSDIRMPKSDGVHLLKLVGGLTSTKPKMIMMTGFTDISDQDLVKLGAVAVIQKPFIAEEILKIFDTHFAKRKNAS